MTHKFKVLNQYMISYSTTSKQTDGAKEIAAKIRAQAQMIESIQHKLNKCLKLLDQAPTPNTHLSRS